MLLKTGRLNPGWWTALLFILAVSVLACSSDTKSAACGTDSDCDDGDSCTQDRCDEELDRCVFSLLEIPGAEGPLGHVTCDNGVDDDCDGATDGLDPDCEQIEPDPCLGWTSVDIGAVGLAGSFECAAGVISVSASGADIWNESDEFRYTYQPVAGDVTIVAQVLSHQASEGWSKAGVMIRESLAPDSMHAHMLLSRGAENTSKFDMRLSSGATTAGSYGSALSAPYWVKIERRGNVFEGFESSDGLNWTLVGQQTAPMASDAFAGLSLTSHDDAALATAVFDHVSIEPGVSDLAGVFQWQLAELSVAESADRVQLAVSRLGGSAGEATVQWSTQAGTANSPGDFEAVEPTTLTFAQGQVSQIVTVAISPDALDEEDEQFTLLLDSATVASIHPAGAVATVTILDDDGPQPELKAFPSAQGFGRAATGGRGGEVRKVTNLNDSGPGSFRDAVQTPGAAYVVFEVAGTINLLSKVDITADKTIAGETAFRNGGQGITLKINQGTTKNTLVVVPGGSHNIICRYIRFRRGPGLAPEVDGDTLLLLGSGTDFIFDHCSFSWSTDEIINPYGPTDMSFQNCIFSEALFNATHAYTTDPEHSSYPNPHSMGPLIGNGTSRLTFFGCLFAHNNQRNPLVGGSVGGGSEFELVNNVIYNYGYFGTVFGFDGTPVFVNFINNNHIAGPDSSSSRYAIAIIDGVTAYARGNINNKRTSAGDPEWAAIGCSSGCGDYMVEPAPGAWQSTTAFDFPLKEHQTMSDSAVRQGVLDNAGANLFKDAVDTRIFDDVQNGTGGFIDDPSEVGGWPSLSDMSSVPEDSDDDGLADDWESQTFGSLAKGANDDEDGDGYTNLEEYFHFLAGE